MKPITTSPASSLGEINRSAMLATLVVPCLAGTVWAEDAGSSSNERAETDKADHWTRDEVTKMNDVVVVGEAERQLSSPKYTTALVDTPQTIVVIPSSIYAQQGAATLSDVLRNTPGITFAAGEGGGASSTAGDAFYMRGFDASNNIFIDGVRDVGAYSRDVFNLEQVEVVKGPTGSDVGRGVSSGYVNLSTKTPRAENFADAVLTYGFDEQTSGSRRRGTLDANQTLGKAPIAGTALRLNAMWQDNDGVGREYAGTRSWGLAPSLALGLGTPTRLHLSYQHLEQDSVPDYGLPGALHPGYVSTPPPPAVERSTFYGFESDYDEVASDVYTGRFEHDFSRELRVSNQLRFGTNERNAVVTAPGTSAGSYAPATGLLTRSRQGNKRDTEVLSNQTNLGAELRTGALVHSLSAGLELTREKSYSPSFTSAALSAIPLAQPEPEAEPQGVPVRSGAYTKVSLKTAAGYLFDTVKLGERWLLNGGLRVERYEIDYFSMAATGLPTELSASRGLATWKAGLVFKPAPAGSLYVSYGVSRKPPGSDFTLSSAAGNQNNPDTDPQKTSNAELGLKWNLLSKRLLASAALFRTENDKTVFTDPVLGPIPAGKQTVQGVELGLTGRVSERWLVYGGFAFLDSTVDSGTEAQISYGLPLIAKYSGSLWTSYRITDSLTIGGGAQYQGEANRLQNTSGAPVTMPSYWLFNALASYQLTQRLSLRLNVSNLFDEEYTQSYNNNGGRFMPGAPRAYLVTAELKF